MPDLAGLDFQLAWLILPLIGCIAGFLAGLLGIGGGIILVPGLFFFLKEVGYANGYEIQFAIATSLGCIVPTSLSASFVHFKMKNIDWGIYKVLVPGFLIGGVAGGLLGDYLDPVVLERAFGALCLLIAIRIFIGFTPKPQEERSGNSVKHSVNGGLMGTVAALTGVGGGALVNPYMLWAGYPMRYAIGTASAAVVAISSFGALTYCLATPSSSVELPTIGYVMWPAVIAVAVFSMSLAPFGAIMAKKLPTKQLKQALAIILLIVGIKFLF